MLVRKTASSMHFADMPTLAAWDMTCRAMQSTKGRWQRRAVPLDRALRCRQVWTWARAVGSTGGLPGSVTVRCRGPSAQSIPPTWNASKRRQPAWPLPLGAPRLRGVNVAIPEGTPQWSMCSTSTETRLGTAVHAPRHRGGNLQLGQCHTTLLSPCFENRGTANQTRVRQHSTRPVRPRHRCGQWSNGACLAPSSDNRGTEGRPWRPAT